MEGSPPSGSDRTVWEPSRREIERANASRLMRFHGIEDPGLSSLEDPGVLEEIRRQAVRA